MSNEVVNDKNLKSLKSLSKVIYVLAIIGRVVTIIGAVFATLGMAIAIICLSTINIKTNDGIEIGFGDNVVKISNIEENLNNDTLTITANGEKVDIDDKEAIDAIRLAGKYINEENKEKLIGFLAVTMIFTLVILILSAILLKKVEKLFKNISKESTPFIKENVEHIRKCAYYMIAITIISAMESGLANALLGGTTSISGTSIGFSLITILIIFAAARVFDYGCKLEEKNEEKVIGDVNK